MRRDTAPDIETASADYSTRFAGPAGEYLLDVQADTVIELLPSSSLTTKLRILEIGGGHGQLVEHILGRGHEVWVHGSHGSALEKLAPLAESNKSLHLIESSMYSLPFEDHFFDAVIAVRILAHVDDVDSLIREWARVARRRIIFDYPPLRSFNALYPLLFRLKKTFEKNTRTYAIYSLQDFRKVFEQVGWTITAERRQFFLPMVFHRVLQLPPLSRALEGFFSISGLTALAGSPAVLAADKGIVESSMVERALDIAPEIAP